MCALQQNDSFIQIRKAALGGDESWLTLRSLLLTSTAIMPSFLKSFKESVHPSSSSSHGPELPRSSTNFYGYDVPPEWAPAPEKSVRP